MKVRKSSVTIILALLMSLTLFTSSSFAQSVNSSEKSFTAANSIAHFMSKTYDWRCGYITVIGWHTVYRQHAVTYWRWVAGRLVPYRSWIFGPVQAYGPHLVYRCYPYVPPRIPIEKIPRIPIDRVPRVPIERIPPQMNKLHPPVFG